MFKLNKEGSAIPIIIFMVLIVLVIIFAVAWRINLHFKQGDIDLQENINGSLNLTDVSIVEQVNTTENETKTIESSCEERGLYACGYKDYCPGDPTTLNGELCCNVKCLCNITWECSEWGECIDNFRYKECIDLNGCGSNTGKPEEKEVCGGLVVGEPLGFLEITEASSSNYQFPIMFRNFFLVQNGNSQDDSYYINYYLLEYDSLTRIDYSSPAEKFPLVLTIFPDDPPMEQDLTLTIDGEEYVVCLPPEERWLAIGGLDYYVDEFGSTFYLRTDKGFGFYQSVEDALVVDNLARAC